MAPVTLNDATPPYAYVVDYRPLDACSTPACHIKGRQVLGFANDVQSDGDPGAYVQAGNGLETELYYRRGVVLRPHEKYEFTLPPSTAASELDAYLSSALGQTNYSAKVSFSIVQPASGPTPAGEQLFDGFTPAFMMPMTEQEKHATFFRHIRVPVPSRAGRLVRVTIENTGKQKMSVGSPLVMRRVEGRGPRQAVFAFFDAVPFHQMNAVFRGETGEAKTGWVAKAIADRGLFFPDAVSPSQATVPFLLRFFSGDLFGGRGWPGMYGLGVIDESLPSEVRGPIARLAEQGFITELAGDNFAFAPTFALTALDGAFQDEGHTHAALMERYVDAWATAHPRDDVFFILWNAQTHSLWRTDPSLTGGSSGSGSGPSVRATYAPGRDASDAPLPKELHESEVNKAPNTGVWRNFMDGLDHLQAELATLRRGAPDANQVVWIGADHSRGITRKMQTRAYRALRGFGTDLSHGSADTIEEMRTPYALLFDGPDKVPAPNGTRVVPGVTSSLGVWRVLESRFGLDFGLAPSTSFDHPVFPGARAANPWVDRVFTSIGIAGSMRVTSGDLAYGLFSPTRTDKSIWSLPISQQRVMLGAPTRNGFIVAEELYDDARDPYELKSIANDRLDDVLHLRRELVDFVATYYDPPEHPRNVYTLLLPERMQLRISSFGKLRVLVDGEAVPSVDPRSIVVTASKLEIVETEDPLGVIEIAALDRKAPVLLRCAANGLMLDQVSDERPRLSLALARTNCPLPATGREVARPNEILFTVRKAVRGDMGSAPGLPSAGGTSHDGVDSNELITGMKRWGYVRDIDEKKP